jgi:hypothetical protein
MTMTMTMLCKSSKRLLLLSTLTIFLLSLLPSLIQGHDSHDSHDSHSHGSLRRLATTDPDHPHQKNVLESSRIVPPDGFLDPDAGFRIVPSGVYPEDYRKKDSNYTCNPVPIRNETLSNGTEIEIFTEEKYFVVFLAEENNRTNRIDVFALGHTFQPAYNTSIDNCTTWDVGANRSVTNCTVVLEQIVFERDALLIQCLEYTSTSIDGNVTIYYNETQNYYNKTKEAATGTCECTCDGPAIDQKEEDNEDDAWMPLPTFLQLVSPNNTCNCPGCNDDDGIPNCVCYAPYIDTLVDNWNTLYKNQSGALGINVTITNVTEVTVLPSNCSLVTSSGRDNITYYNSTSVCLPGIQPTNHPTNHPTHSPSRKPTEHPSKKPTSKPSRYPTRKPTRHPTRKPTRHPTRKPTRHPTRKPTRHPTHPTRKPSRKPTVRVFKKTE